MADSLPTDAGMQEESTVPQVPEDSAQAAIAESEALNATLLKSQAERSFADLQTKNQQLMKQCSDYQSRISNLEANVEELRGSLKVKSDECDSLAQQQKRDKSELQRSQEREKDVCERMARVDVEADFLREEISRLTASNKALSAQITKLETSAKLSSSSSAPLQFENSRLRTEISSLTAHCNWLEEELHSRSNQNAEEKMKNAKLIQELRSELSEIKSDYDEAISKVSMLSMQNETQKKRVEMSQKELLQKEQDHSDVVHELNLEIQSERKLVILNKENYARLEERYHDAVREMKSMKELAIAAEKDHQEEILAIKDQVESHFHKMLAQVQEENEKQMQEYQQQLEAVNLEKIELEDKFMSHNSNRGIITLGESDKASLALTDGEPMTLTALYGKLADAQDEVRKERAERKRLELYLERVHRDIEREAPRQRQERKEYDLAMAQNQDLHSRLNEALEENNLARRELQQLQRELTDTSKECYELRMENKDMAMQVQNLLQKSLDGEDLAAEIQGQNQQLLKEHHRMSMKISELQKRIDDDHVQQQIEELDLLRGERDKQAALVANIVHQRDLYRALLNKNDQTLLANYGADGAIVAAKDQIEKFTNLDSKNKELEQALTKLNADIISMTNEKVGMNEKISRLDTLCSDLSNANHNLEAELCASRAAIARNNAESKFYKEKVERLEESIEIMRDDLSRANEDKKNLQRLSDDLQTMLSSSKDEQSKLESQLRATSMQLRLVNTNAKSFKDEETRLHAENNSLRSELARYMSLHDSMQKIENSLSMRCDEEQQRLKEENLKLKETLDRERSIHFAEIEGLKNQLEDDELRFRQAEKERNEAVVTMISLREKLDFATTEMKSITENYTTLQNTVNEANSQSVGANNDKEIIEDLSHELAKVKCDLEAAQKKIDDYKVMAQSSEMSLKTTTEASEEFKKTAVLEVERLKGDLQRASDNAALKQNLLDEAIKELETSRMEFNQKIEDLNATILSLTTELETSRQDKDASKEQRDSVLEEMRIYRSEANAAKDNYERELALHADARKELHSLRMKLDEETRSHICTKDQLKELEIQVESEKKSWENSTVTLKEAHKNSEDRLVEAQKQIEILHNHVARLTESLEKAQSSQHRTASESEDSLPTQNEVVARLEKEIFDLRQVVNYQKNEKNLIEAQLESSRRTAERERAAAEIVKRSLKDLRSELQLQQDDTKEVLNVSSMETAASLQTKLKVADEQLVLLRESNKMLRLETEKLNMVVETLKSETNIAKSALEPMNKKCMSLEVSNSELEAEKASLRREVDAWKERVQGLLKKFNQIDPEEHAKALKSIEESEHRCSELIIAKEKAEKETATAKSLVNRLNKELLKIRSNLDASNASLAQLKSENEELAKSKSGSIDTLKKEIETVKKMKDQSEKDLAAAKTEIVALSSRLENLKNISRSNKAKVLESQKNLEAALKKEREISKLLEEEKEAHKAALQLTDRLQVASKIEKGNGISVVPHEEKGASEEGQIVPDVLQVENLDEEKIQMNNSEVANLQSSTSAEQKASTKDSLRGSIHDGAIPLPKVPDGGFQFIPSNASTRLIDLAETLVSMDETENANTQDSQAQQECDPTIKPKSNNDPKPITATVSNMDSLREKLLQKKKRALELKTGVPPAKRHAPVDIEKKESMGDRSMKEGSIEETSEKSHFGPKDVPCKTYAKATRETHGATEPVQNPEDCDSKATQAAMSKDISADVSQSVLGGKKDGQSLVVNHGIHTETDKVDRTNTLISKTTNPIIQEPIAHKVHDSSSGSTSLSPQPSDTKASLTQLQDDSSVKTVVNKDDCPDEEKETTDIAGSGNHTNSNSQ